MADVLMLDNSAEVLLNLVMLLAVPAEGQVLVTRRVNVWVGAEIDDVQDQVFIKVQGRVLYA